MESWVKIIKYLIGLSVWPILIFLYSFVGGVFWITGFAFSTVFSPNNPEMWDEFKDDFSGMWGMWQEVACFPVLYWRSK